ncbi:MAG: atuH [Deltaproteobacteria bacterium]|nr:atuH [Deltaproteobacteria bacterium]
MVRPVDLIRAVPRMARELETLLGGRREAPRRLLALGRKLPSIVRGLRIARKTDRSEALSIGWYLQRNARVWPERTALIFEDRRYTHRELDEAANRWANALAARGIRKGDAVAVFVDNRPELLFAVAGIVKLGAIAAMINSRQHGRALEHSLKVAKAVCVVVGEELWGPYQAVHRVLSLPGDRVLWLADRGTVPAPAGTSDTRELLGNASLASPPQLADVQLGDPCFYIYTSGTTGLPKASIMSHFRWVKGGGAFGMAALGLGVEDVLYVPLPLYHSSALVLGWSSCASTGATFAMRRKFSASAFWDDVRRYRVTAFVYIGELCRYLLNQPPDAFYGASEGNIAFVNLLNADCTVGLCPADYALVQYDVDRDEPIRDAAGKLVRVERGETGLLLAKVSDRYAFDGYTDPEASHKKLMRDVFEPGDVWFNSGDLLRDQGLRHAQFVDRVGDTFRWKGENVSTNEVAEVINTFPQVAESTVYGVHVPGADGRCGMAALVLRVSLAELDLAGLASHLRAHLPAYAVPRFLRVQETLEVTVTFKQVKGELRREGFDPGVITDRLFVLAPTQAAYQPLTPALHGLVLRNELAL